MPRPWWTCRIDAPVYGAGPPSAAAKNSTCLPLSRAILVPLKKPGQLRITQHAVVEVPDDSLERLGAPDLRVNGGHVVCSLFIDHAAERASPRAHIAPGYALVFMPRGRNSPR